MSTIPSLAPAATRTARPKLIVGFFISLVAIHLLALTAFLPYVFSWWGVASLLLGNFIESNPVPVKAAMKMMGILQNDTVRLPLAPIGEANRKKLELILRECKLL